MTADRAFLTPKELAQRGRLNHQTLANWRHKRQGPPFIRIGTRVLYPIEGVMAFEKICSAWLDTNNQSQLNP